MKDIKFIILKYPKSNFPGPDGFTAELYQTLTKNYYQFYTNLSRKLNRKLYYSIYSLKVVLSYC